MKRILSLLLILCMLIPVFSFAELEEDDFSVEEMEEELLLDDEDDESDDESEENSEGFDFSDLDEDSFATLDENIDSGTINLDELEINPNLPSNVVNFLLLGVDSHIPVEKDSNGEVIHKNIVGLADTQIIVSVNKDTGDIKMTSVQRDSYVPIPGPTAQKQKINMSFEIGVRRGKKVVDDPDNFDKLTPYGAALAMRTINHNFELNIQHCVVINFSGLASIIDALGGIDIDMQKIEAKGVNNYLAKAYKKPGKFTYDPTYDKKTRTSTRQKLEVKDGVQHCDGIQALTYARLRSLKGQNDFNRTDRQRHLLDLLMKKVLHDIDMNKLLDLIDTCVQYAYTNINAETFLSLAGSLLSSGILKRIDSSDSLFDQRQIPAPGQYAYGNANGTSVLTFKNKEGQVRELHEFIYGTYYPAN